MRGLTLAAVIFVAALCFIGCTRQYATLEEAAEEGAQLGENIYIDGIDVSGMEVSRAREQILSAKENRIAETVYVLTAPDGSAELPCSELELDIDVDTALMEALALGRRSEEPRMLYSTVKADAEGLRAALSACAKELDKDAVNATAEYDGSGFTYTEHQNGYAVDVMELAERIGAAVSDMEGGKFEAVTAQIPAEYSTDMAKADTALIAEFSTSFSGSTYSKKNRVYNIEKAAKLINGTVIAPGGSFDMNAVIGDRTEKNGWKEAAAIRDGAYTQEYGGGVCQVSTTLYNAALMANMEIVERHHHSWPLGYVDIGRDATISTDGPNFIFTNTSGASVTLSVHTDTENKTVTVRLYGRKEFEGHIEITSKKVESLETPETETRLDTALPPNTSVEERKARRGSVSETYKNYYDADGNYIRSELVSRDKYRSITGLVALSEDLYYGSAPVLGGSIY